MSANNTSNGIDDRTVDEAVIGQTEEDIRVSKMTLARLLTTVSFHNNETRISNKALIGLSEYIRLFTCEAVIRANEVRLKEAEAQWSRQSRPKLAATSATSKEDNEKNEDDDDEDWDELDEVDDVDDLKQREREKIVAEEVLDTRHLEDIAGLLVLDF